MASGIDNFDLDELKKRGIPLGNTPNVLNNAVADIGVGLLISAARKFKEGVSMIERYFQMTLAKLSHESLDPFEGQAQISIFQKKEKVIFFVYYLKLFI